MADAVNAILSLVELHPPAMVLSLAAASFRVGMCRRFRPHWMKYSFANDTDLAFPLGAVESGSDGHERMSWA
ncbi:unnamed protein product [Protopolystoma xenopodis]|uniref:Uncharacterized protein n=1 Tax=Protopolystoma xenopodis TaxID=117903 RepID=A0A3S5A3Q5_9PLAT|nr:unnamed protein product [Protopolystoma xenopodis]